MVRTTYGRSSKAENRRQASSRSTGSCDRSPTLSMTDSVGACLPQNGRFVRVLRMPHCSVLRERGRSRHLPPGLCSSGGGTSAARELTESAVSLQRRAEQQYRIELAHRLSCPVSPRFHLTSRSRGNQARAARESDVYPSDSETCSAERTTSLTNLSMGSLSSLAFMIEMEIAANARPR